MEILSDDLKSHYSNKDLLDTSLKRNKKLKIAIIG